MKLRFMTSAVAAAMLLTSVAAQADWRFTRWGMSVAQVVSAGEAAETHAISDLKKDRVNDLQRLAEGNVTEAGVALVAEFYFTPDTQRLAMVRYRPAKDLACEDQEAAAVKQYGQGKAADTDANIVDDKGGTLTYTDHHREWVGSGGDSIAFSHAMYHGRSLQVCTWVIQPG